MTEDARPKFSLIVATLNRPTLFTRLIDSLAAQEAGPLQVIVIDQSDDMAAQENAVALARYANAMDIVHLRQDGRGLSRARNLGLSKADGGLIGFPDDDCWYAPSLLSRVRDWFGRHPGHSFVSGRFTEPDRQISRRYDPNPTDLTTWNAFLRVASVTLFFRRDALTGERFDERIGAGCALPVGEELDLALRLLRNDCRGRYAPELVVYHPVVPFDREDGAAFRRHEAAYGYVLAKHARAGSCPVAARLMLGLAKAAGRTLWSPTARHSLAGRWQGIATALAARGELQ